MISIRKMILTGFGVGLIPKAPGTFGSLWGILLWTQTAHWDLLLKILLVTSVYGIGVLAIRSQVSTPEDNPEIIIDEICGQYIALIFAPLSLPLGVVGFAAFRYFDIRKPWWVGWCDKNLKGASGIMLDDIVAGFMAIAVVTLAQLVLSI